MSMNAKLSEDETDFNFFSSKKNDQTSPSTSTSSLNENTQVPLENLPIIPKEKCDYYKMNHKNRGIAMIFNNEEFDIPGHLTREGSDKDCEKLEKVLHNLKFKVQVFNDKDYNEIIMAIDEVARKTDHENNDCLLVVVMTHGQSGDKICAKDKYYNIKEIWEPFIGDNCPTLVGKPKLFFIQACRGIKMDSGVPARVEFDGAPIFENTYRMQFPSLADFLFMYSTQPGHESFRNVDHGSWFIQSLCEELSERAKKYDLQTVLTFVNRRMAFNYLSNAPRDLDKHKKKQVGSMVSSLTRLVCFKK